MTMSLDEAIRTRRSVRGFLDKPVPEAIMREVFALASYAPSNCNVQPWMPHVVSGNALKSVGEAMVATAIGGTPPQPDFILNAFEGVHRERQIDAAVQLYGAMGIGRKDREARDRAFLRNLEFFDAPHAVFIFMHESFSERAAVDIGIYVQTLMLAMTSRGLASCAQGALGHYPDIVRENLGVDPSQKLLMGISFGYEDENVDANRTRVGRADIDNSVAFHQE